MYDIETDIENVAKAIFQMEWTDDWSDIPSRRQNAYKRTARVALNASTAVTLLKEAEERIKAVEDTKDNAYWERNQLVAALSKMFPAWTERHPESDTTWEDDWRNIIFIDLPTGQASWHIHDSEWDNFRHLPQSAYGICSWDGHTTEEKYSRLAAITPPKQKD